MASQPQLPSAPVGWTPLTLLEGLGQCCHSPGDPSALTRKWLLLLSDLGVCSVFILSRVSNGCQYLLIHSLGAN